VEQTVDNSLQKVGKGGNFLSFKNNATLLQLTKNLLNIASSIFSLKIRHVVGGRLYVRQNIVTAEYKNSICWTAINTHSWERERFVWRYKRTLAMRGLLKAALRAKDIDIFVQKEHGRMPTVLDIQRHPPRQCEGGMVTDYELRYLRTVVYASITK